MCVKQGGKTIENEITKNNSNNILILGLIAGALQCYRIIAGALQCYNHRLLNIVGMKLKTNNLASCNLTKESIILI